MSMIGMFVVHPRNPAPEYRVDRDFALLLSEWTIEAGTARPNTLKMNDFNILAIKGKVFPSTAPLVGLHDQWVTPAWTWENGGGDADAEKYDRDERSCRPLRRLYFYGWYDDDEDSGWYQHPAGTVAMKASAIRSWRETGST